MTGKVDKVLRLSFLTINNQCGKFKEYIHIYIFWVNPFNLGSDPDHTWTENEFRSPNLA